MEAPHCRWIFFYVACNVTLRLSLFCPEIINHGALIFDPSVREGKLQCPCSSCRSDCFENYAVKVVQVKHGYVSVLATLKSVDNVHCILVCEPNYLVGVEESGKLHLWSMNSTWR